MEIVWIYYGFIYAIANSIVGISLFFSSALSLGRVVHVSVQIIPLPAFYTLPFASCVDSIGESFFRKNNI